MTTHGGGDPAPPNVAISYRRLRAPQQDGAALIDPPLAEAPRLLDENAALVAELDFDVSGRSFSDLRRQARADLLDVAHRYTRSFRDVALEDDELDQGDRPLILTGHQPQLFHPGVWFKNFALSSVARRVCGVPVNLIIDNDTVREKSIRVPANSDGVHLASIPFDRAGADIPFEERPVFDEATFQSFGERVEQAMAPFVEAPLARSLWKEAPGGEANLGRRIAQARSRLETRWNVASWEAPLGEICQSEPFLWFACHLLVEARRFAADHNRALADYRSLHRIRNRLHPVPSLAGERSADKEWVEAPFWIWTRSDPRRRKVFQRTRSAGIELTDRADLSIRLPLSLEGSAGSAANLLSELALQGIKLRPRALITTLYARLFLSDLFLHGVGGAKYDQVTDAIIGRFFGVRAPLYLTVTATCRLPIDRPNATNDDVRKLDQELRDLRFHPETRLDRASGEAADIITRKKQWIAKSAMGGLSAADRAQRHVEIVRANEALAPLIAAERDRLVRERGSLVEPVRAAKILGSREFSICLFPEERLCDRLRRLAIV